MSRSYGLTLARLKSVIATEQYNTKSVLQNEKKAAKVKCSLVCRKPKQLDRMEKKKKIYMLKTTHGETIHKIGRAKQQPIATTAVAYLFSPSFSQVYFTILRLLIFFSNIWCETTHISSCHSQTGDNFSRVNHNRCIKIVTFYNHHWPSIALGHFNPFTLRTEIYYFIQRENVIYLFPLCCCVWRIGQRTRNRKRRQNNKKNNKKAEQRKRKLIYMVPS